jgi:ribosomal protein S18 acetylase RimI-like enzyme
MDMTVRPVAEGDLDALARLWHDGWHDGHGHIAPAGLTKARTLASFRERLGNAMGDTFVLGRVGSPLGFFMLKDDELYQFYVGREARGSNVAPALMSAAEAELARRGYTSVWLACGVGNDRAARFYDKTGWRNARTATNVLDTQDGPFEIDIWRYEKDVRAP